MQLNANNSGIAAEKLAETFLKKQGLKLIANNYHCAYGEIDLIMQDKNTLVFIEVRLRTNSQFGSPGESITFKKQQKIIKTAQYYLQQHNTQQDCRFDAVLLNKQNVANIEWIRNAFET
jgi:putative endonuclease